MVRLEGSWTWMVLKAKLILDKEHMKLAGFWALELVWNANIGSLIRDCYRNPLCGWEHQMGAALVIRWLVRAWKHWVPFLFYAFRCCLLFFLALILVVLGVPPCRFCSSTAEHLIVASCRRSQRTSNYSSTCCAYCGHVCFLLRTLFSDWLFVPWACPYSIMDSAVEF